MMRLPLLRKRISIILLLLFSLLFLNIFSREVRNFLYSFFSPLQSTLWDVGWNVSDFFGGIFQGNDVRRENQMLEKENLVLLGQVAELEDLQRENKELREVLNLGIEKDFQMVLTEIIGKSIGQDVIIVKGGKEQGIGEGMSLITSEKVVVGKVLEVFDNSSRVQLLSHPKSTFDVQISGRQVTGVIKGQGRYRLLLDFVPQEEILKAGDLVVTSSLGGIFPENLLVGKVEDIVKGGAEPFQRASVSPFFDIRSQASLFVITSL
ncbi:MAG: rod shape-determining protein MreC [Patescibacteria group bacterium]